ncbi:3099_t:CDS:2 [Paraglomus occultum]|uniref:3099_t:CDS:1 n=1 Tax=Paraglomus occultum TaxID=144539 RepID=A0A9N9F9X7_9GLOM|nr:3099_t:CDS:2 [Paraglomus occultum]
MSMAARVASVACSSKECTDKVLAVLQRVYYEICDIAKINPESADNGFVSSPSPNDFSVNYPSCVINVKNIPSRPGKKTQSTSESIPQSKSIDNHNSHTDTLIQQEQEHRVTSALEYTANTEKSPTCEEARIQRQLLVTKMDESVFTNYSSTIVDKESTVSDASSFGSCNGVFQFEQSVKETHSNELIVNEDSGVQLTSIDNLNKIDQNMKGLRFFESRNVDYTSEVKSSSDEVDNDVRFVIPSNAATSVSNGSPQMSFVSSDPYHWALYHPSMRQRIQSSRLSFAFPEQLNIATSMQRQSSLNYSQQYSQTCSPQSIPHIQHHTLSSDQLSDHAQQYQQTHYSNLQPVWYS